MKEQHPATQYTHCKICKKKLGRGRDHRFGICHDHVDESLTFKKYLSIISEDLSSDITKLQGDISMIDTQVAQRTNNLIQQKQRLQKVLAVKQRQKEVEDKKLQSQAKSKVQPNFQPTQDIQRGQ